VSSDTYTADGALRNSSIAKRFKRCPRRSASADCRTRPLIPSVYRLFWRFRPLQGRCLRSERSQVKACRAHTQIPATMGSRGASRVSGVHRRVAADRRSPTNRPARADTHRRAKRDPQLPNPRATPSPAATTNCTLSQAKSSKELTWEPSGLRTRLRRPANPRIRSVIRSGVIPISALLLGMTSTTVGLLASAPQASARQTQVSVVSCGNVIASARKPDSDERIVLGSFGAPPQRISRRPA
jgi:hypothetical protein